MTLKREEELEDEIHRLREENERLRNTNGKEEDS